MLQRRSHLFLESRSEFRKKTMLKSPFLVWFGNYNEVFSFLGYQINSNRQPDICKAYKSSRFIGFAYFSVWKCKKREENLVTRFQLQGQIIQRKYKRFSKRTLFNRIIMILQISSSSCESKINRIFFSVSDSSSTISSNLDAWFRFEIWTFSVFFIEPPI